MISSTLLLNALPPGLRDPLIAEYTGIATAFSEGRWKLSALDAGRFCEVVFTILDGALAGAYPVAPSKPNRFADACKALENRAPIAVGDRSLRILIPRVLPGLYEIRNNRDVGHVGGDVTANKMDATYLFGACTWVMAELVRVFHATSITEAQESVDALVERRIPILWEHQGTKRVLAPTLKARDKVLILLHGSPGGETAEDLQAWVKYKANFREQVLIPLADDLQVELSALDGKIVITPLGTERVEKTLLPSLTQ